MKFAIWEGESERENVYSRAALNWDHMQLALALVLVVQVLCQRLDGRLVSYLRETSYLAKEVSEVSEMSSQLSSSTGGSELGRANGKEGSNVNRLEGGWA